MYAGFFIVLDYGAFRLTAWPGTMGFHSKVRAWVVGLCFHSLRPYCGGAWGSVRRSWGNVEGLGLARPSAGFGQMAPRPAPLFSTRGRAPGAGFTGNGAFQCFRVLGAPDAHLGRKWPRPGLGRWVQVRGPEGCSGLRASTVSAPPGENIGRGCCAPGDCARGATALFTVGPRAAAYAALRRDPAAPVDGFTSSWVARRHAPSPRVGAVGPSSASGRNSSGMWSRPSEFARATSAIMCRVLGRTPLSPSSASPFRDGCRDGG